MKLTKLPDGTIQIEGTAEEVRALLDPPKDAVVAMPPQAPPQFIGNPPAALYPRVWCGTIKAGGWGITNAAAAQPWFGFHS